MKYQKIRGHKRRQKAIEEWKSENLDVRLDLIKKYNYDYTDIVVHPWCDISIRGLPEPKGKTKQLMLNALIDIYHSWKKQLDKIGEPYYLKIWLYEPRFSKSQVVCGIEDRIDWYENIFFDAGEEKELQTGNYGHLKNKLDALTWEHRVDEDDIDDDYVTEPEQYLTYNDFVESKKWFTRTMKKPHRTYKFDNGTEVYSFKKGNVWLGGQINYLITNHHL
jgi:hypothetical protein